MPRKRNKTFTLRKSAGTDWGQRKESRMSNCFTLTPEGDEPLPGAAVHFPNNPDIFDPTEAQQLTAEEQVEKWVDTGKKYCGTAKATQ